MGRISQTFDKAGLFSLTYFELIGKYKMGKLFLYVTCTVLLSVLLFSTSLGDEESNDVQEAFEIGIKEASLSGKSGGVKKSFPQKKSGRRNSKNVKGKEAKKPKTPKGKKSSRNGKQTKRRKAMKRKSTNSVKRKGKGIPKTNPSLRVSSKQRATATCPTEKATSLKLLYNQVYNFKKQLKRAQNQANIVKKKKAKKDNFAKDAAILTDVVGGNLTNPICSGSSATNAASLASTLSSCSSSITTSCEDITINSTLTGSCSDTMSTFEAILTTCKTDDSCTCWNEAFAMKSSITGCSAVEEANSVKSKKKSCLKIFSSCKSAQDSAVHYTATCPATTTVPTVSTTKSARRRNFVEKLLARNLIRHSHDEAMKA